MKTLDIQLLGAPRALAAAPLRPDTSPHTGRALRRFALELHVPDERHEELEAELHAAATPEGPHLPGSQGNWRVLDGWSTVSTGHRREIRIYRIQVEEVEVLDPSAVEIDGLPLRPRGYREHVEAGTLTVTLVADVRDEDDAQRLEESLAHPDAFHDVVRRGISDTPLRMRFGRCVWQRAQDGTRRHHLELIAGKGGQEAGHRARDLAGQPLLARTAERTMATSRALADLLQELHARGVLDEPRLRAIEAAATPRPPTREETRELTRTDRLSDYWR
ncbi:hypothetical protein [Streptomyces sp. VRA16 Mangrove soil]|uniref:hypothetical protein n=1 Tax=Streptomyces sp. VRA16 Mangrove soil TaxID=2817434 RepID=UPI001A9EC061|nr:hypothetical protein [Streptomyces sp. VRA16 Mangrove soil]MBO1332462.1 hypothetical protein [Streptomyces sp. VRA16 Mangrove soil]